MVIVRHLHHKRKAALTDALFIVGELCLTDAKILCRLLLGDAALLAQQRDNAIEFDPHDPYILFRGSAGIAAGPQ